MIIDKVINHNIVISRNTKDIEVVLMGRGIAFSKKKGDVIDPTLIEKTFHLGEAVVPDNFIRLLSEIPEDIIRVVHEVVELIQLKFSRNINERIYLTLLDHVNYAVERFLQGIQFEHFLLPEIRHLYKEEIAVAFEALKLINQRLMVNLPEDEAAFIAIHIVNAQLDLNISEVRSVTNLIREILNIVRDHFNLSFDETSLDYDRLLTHLKFFSRRLLRSQTLLKKEDFSLYEIVKTRYPDEYQCVLKIEKHIEAQYQTKLSISEKLYLMMHLARLTK